MTAQSSGLQHQVRETVVLRLHCIGALKQHFALYAHVHLLTERRAAANEHFVVRLKQETVVVQPEAVVEFNGEQLRLDLHLFFRLGVNHAAGYVNLAHRGFFRQTAGTENQIFHTLVVGVGKGVRLIDLAVNNHDQVLELVFARGYEELVFVAQLYIFRCAVQYTLQVNSQGEVGSVELHAVEHGAGGRGIFAQPVGCGYQTADCRNILVQTVEARAEHCTLYLYRVLQSRQDSGYVNRVAVHEPERAEVGIADRVYGLCAVVSAHHTNCIGISLAAESSGEVQQAIQRLVRFHLVVHRPFDFAVDAGECAVGVHNHYIAVLQTHIAVQHAVHQITV